MASVGRMTASWRKLLDWMEMGRFELALAAVGNVWLMTFLAFGVEPVWRRNAALEQLGLGWALVAGAVMALGLAGCGAALNDVLDVRHDRAFAPTRPIPSGRVRQTTAVAVAMISLVAGVAAAGFFGQVSVIVALVTALGIVFYNLTGRFVPSVGVVSLGLLQAMSMTIPNPQLAFGWPIWLTMTHVMACSTVQHVLGGKRPRISSRDAWAICLGWIFWSMLLVGIIGARESTATQGAHATSLHLATPSIWVGPAVAVVAFVVVGVWMLHGRTTPGRGRRSAAGRFTQLSMLWMLVYAAGWLLSAELWWQGALMLGLFVVGWGLARVQRVLTGAEEATSGFQVGPSARANGGANIS
jgi:4-hydroxybenzoate polyprenyltransferase